MKRYSFASYLIRFRLVGDDRIWSWVSLAWGSDILRSSIESRATTTAGQYNISLSGLSDLAIPLPPLSEQTEIVSEVDRRLSAADQLADTLEQKLVQTSVMRQSLLRQAFEGRLVPQNIDDKSASVLLEQIRTNLDAKTKKPKGKRMTKPNSKAKAARRPLVDVLYDHNKLMTPEELFCEAGFEPAQVDIFYRELASLRNKLREEKPKASEAKLWPHHAKVLLQLKGGLEK